MCSYGAVAFLSLIEHKESSHERPMGLVFERVMQAAAQGGEAYAASLRMIPLDFHRLPPPLLPLSYRTSWPRCRLDAQRMLSERMLLFALCRKSA